MNPLFLILFFTNSLFVNINTDKNQTLVIHFQDFFEKDFISLKINNCNIFNNLIVKSDASTGFTGIEVKMVREERQTYIIQYFDKKMKCTIKEKSIKLFIMMNAHQNKFLIDPSKGKYIGLNKMNDSTLHFIQTTKGFEYQ